MDPERVRVEIADHVATVTLARPEKHNALDQRMFAAVVAAAEHVAAEPSVRAVVLHGEGPSFCSGLDVSSGLSPDDGLADGDQALVGEVPNRFQRVAYDWVTLPVPVIAAVHGHCLGGGLQIALAADFRIATPDSRWSVLEGKWGIIPDMSGIQSLKELVGIDQAKLLTMTAETFDGSRAKELGLVTELSNDPVASALALAHRLAGKSPDALAAAKRLFDDTWTASPRRTFARERIEQAFLLFSANAKVAREAAFKKAQPVFGPRGR